MVAAKIAVWTKKTLIDGLGFELRQAVLIMASLFAGLTLGFLQMISSLVSPRLAFALFVVGVVYLIMWIYNYGYATLCFGPNHVASGLRQLKLVSNPTRPDDKTRVVVISDTHNQHHRLRLPPGDILIHCGDFTKKGTPAEIKAFDEWLGKVDIPVRVIIPGNHDQTLDPDWPDHDGRPSPLENATHYLVDREVTIPAPSPEKNPVRIYGTSWVVPFPPHRHFGGPATGFMRPSEERKEKFDKIPSGLDILVTHGPPYSIGDRTVTGARAGCMDLAIAVAQKKPKFHCFGHIHEGHSLHRSDSTVFINCASANLLHSPHLHDPAVFDI
jgi:predicted phosphodiesterase/type III secretory pathway component EscS